MRSYFRKGIKDSKTERLLRRVEDVSIVLTGNEKEAFLLENNLIKEHQPKYNIVLKDDKTYVSLRLSVQDQFPALTITRNDQGRRRPLFRPPSPREGREGAAEGRPVHLPREEVQGFRLQRQDETVHPGGHRQVPGPVRRIGSDEKAYRAIVDEIADFLHGQERQAPEEARRADRGGRTRVELRGGPGQEGEIPRHKAARREAERPRAHGHKQGRVGDSSRRRAACRMVVLDFRKGVLISKRIFKESFTPRPRRLALVLSLSVLRHAGPSPTRSSCPRRSRTSRFSSSTLRKKRKGGCASSVRPTRARPT